MKLGARHISAVCCGALCCGTALAAGLPAAGAQTPAPAPVQAPATPSAARVPSSLLDQSPAPPVVDFAAGRLTIRASNSSLRAILDDLETRTGTRVEGLGRDERIFGVYGPGNPQDVLSSLLDDSGYNVLISGRKADGSPREVVLSARAAGSATASAPQAGARTQAADEDDESDGAENTPALPPAAFTPPPPQQQPNQPAGTPQQVKTPQQMLEELQRIRQSAQPQQGAPQQQ